MRRSAALLLAAMCAATCAFAIACSGDDGGGANTGGDPTRPPGIDAPLGGITRLPGGTAVPVDLRVLTSIKCANDTLTIVTDRETLIAAMSCDRMFPDAITSRFIGKEVAIRYEDDRLIIENVDEGTLELPSDRPSITEAA